MPTGDDVPNGYIAGLVDNDALMVCTLNFSKVFRDNGCKKILKVK